LYDKERNETNFYIDGGKFGNDLRFVNDYRNIGSQNARLAIGFDEHGYPTIVIKTNRRCKKGEEVLVDYSDEFASLMQRKKT